MVPLDGKPLLECQLKVLRTVADDIVIVRGYLSEAIDFPGVRTCENKNYCSTGIVGSLMSAREELDEDCLVCYSDIVYEPQVAEIAANCRSAIGVVVDVDYQDYWHARLDSEQFPDDFEQDQESLCIDRAGKITALGDPHPREDQLDGRYVGLIRFSQAGGESFRQAHDELTDRFGESDQRWRHSASFRQASMTDMLQELIDRGQQVDAIPIKRGWLEMDTVEDYERYHQWVQDGSMQRFFRGL